MIKWFEAQTQFLFLSSSVLLIYDAEGEAADVSHFCFFVFF
jgi:hypothetical protein